MVSCTATITYYIRNMFTSLFVFRLVLSLQSVSTSRAYIQYNLVQTCTYIYYNLGGFLAKNKTPALGLRL